MLFLSWFLSAEELWWCLLTSARRRLSDTSLEDGDSVGGNTGNGLLRKDSAGDNGSALEGEVALVAAMSISSRTGVPSSSLLLCPLLLSLSVLRRSCGGD